MKDLEIGQFIKGQLQFVRRRSHKRTERKRIDVWMKKVQLIEDELTAKPKSK